MFLAKDHAAFDIDLVKFAGWADIGQTSCADSVKGGNTENGDCMGIPCREVVRLFYIRFSSTTSALARSFPPRLVRNAPPDSVVRNRRS
jgi:hypothetical protein